MSVGSFELVLARHDRRMPGRLRALLREHRELIADGRGIAARPVDDNVADEMPRHEIGWTRAKRCQHPLGADKLSPPAVPDALLRHQSGELLVFAAIQI